MANPQQQILDTQKAIQHFQAGQLDEAKKLLDNVCRQNAKIDVAYFLLATIYFQMGKLDAAQKHFYEATKLNPGHFEALNNLGVVYERLGDDANAEKFYKKAINTKPDYASALFHLGNLYQNSARPNEALTFYKKCLASNPDHIKALNNLASLYINENHCDEALVLLHKANKLNPNDAEVITNIGFALREKGELDQALTYFEKAVSMDNSSSNAFNQMGVLYQQLDESDKAERAYLDALQRNPDDPETLTNLGNHYVKMGDHDRARPFFEKAISIDPSYGAAWNNLGSSLKTQGNMAEAMKIYEQGEKRSPASAEIHYNLGVSQLATGQFAKGWANYLFRPAFHNQQHNTHIESLARDLTGKKILIVNDQGLGDELFFLRFMPLLKARGAEISYFPQQKIFDLVKQFQCIDHVIDHRAPNTDFDYVLNVGNLPHLLGVTDTSALALPLKPEENRLARLRTILANFGPPPYIGLTWRGGTKLKGKLFKEIAMNNFANAFKDIRATFIALQRQPESGEISELSELLGKPLHDATEYNEDLQDMLALLSLLDLYVGVSNTNMHLCAALGKRAMVLVPHPGEWRWMAEGDASPWFPDFTVFRQTRDKSWDEAIRALRLALNREQAPVT